MSIEIGRGAGVPAVHTRIKEYRTRLSMTQEYLAKAVGVRRETIVFLEQGKYNPSLRLAHDVAKILDAKIDDLFIFDDEQPEPDTPESRVVLVD
jgi:putative transcriptional regulator